MKFKIKKNYKGFSLYEILAVISIIGIVSTLAMVYFGNIRADARDVQRISDIDSVHAALEMYYKDNNTYPISLFPGEALTGPNGRVYLPEIPSNPLPDNDGNCISGRGYIYQLDDNGISYSIDYCLGDQQGEMIAGKHVAIPAGPDAGEVVNHITYHSGQVTSYRTGDDAYNDGLVKRYSGNCGTGTVIDRSANLCWQIDDQPDKLWDDAIDYCNTLTLGGHSDWRLPSIMEGITMLDYSCAGASSDCYSNFQNNALDWSDTGGNSDIWSSTTISNYPNGAYVLFVGYAFPYVFFMKSSTSAVRCVRGSSIFHTGQTTSYRTGDDADNDGLAKDYVEAGCGSGTVLETTSDLCWQKDDQPNKLWVDAIDYCANLVLGDYDDWRLPSIIEGTSMLDYSCDSSAPAHCNNSFRNNNLNWVNTNLKAALWLSTTRSNSTVNSYFLMPGYYGATFVTGIGPYDRTTWEWPVRCVR